mmetsp:Transcript_25648/g.78903  ORF Transcript_25648/g.78903 Transcript_25648/m.78903 type:complete len:310 (-) Transcript_25648:202-1131(-)
MALGRDAARRCASQRRRRRRRRRTSEQRGKKIAPQALLCHHQGGTRHFFASEEEGAERLQTKRRRERDTLSRERTFSRGANDVGRGDSGVVVVGGVLRTRNARQKGLFAEGREDLSAGAGDVVLGHGGDGCEDEATVQGASAEAGSRHDFGERGLAETPVAAGDLAEELRSRPAGVAPESEDASSERLGGESHGLRSRRQVFRQIERARLGVHAHVLRPHRHDARLVELGRDAHHHAVVVVVVLDDDADLAVELRTTRQADQTHALTRAHLFRLVRGQVEFSFRRRLWPGGFLLALGFDHARRQKHGFR